MDGSNFGFRIEPENIVCDGCLADQSQTLDLECQIRPCVIIKKLENCAGCDQYICEKLKDRIFEYESVKERMKAEIPEEDRIRFILPYGNKQRLDEIRQDHNR